MIIVVSNLKNYLFLWLSLCFFLLWFCCCCILFLWLIFMNLFCEFFWICFAFLTAKIKFFKLFHQRQNWAQSSHIWDFVPWQKTKRRKQEQNKIVSQKKCQKKSVCVWNSDSQITWLKFSDTLFWFSLQFFLGFSFHFVFVVLFVVVQFSNHFSCLWLLLLLLFEFCENPFVLFCAVCLWLCKLLLVVAGCCLVLFVVKFSNQFSCLFWKSCCFVLCCCFVGLSFCWQEKRKITVKRQCFQFWTVCLQGLNQNVQLCITHVCTWQSQNVLLFAWICCKKICFFLLTVQLKHFQSTGILADCSGNLFGFVVVINLARMCLVPYNETNKTKEIVLLCSVLKGFFVSHKESSRLCFFCEECQWGHQKCKRIQTFWRDLCFLRFLRLCFFFFFASNINSNHDFHNYGSWSDFLDKDIVLFVFVLGWQQPNVALLLICEDISVLRKLSPTKQSWKKRKKKRVHFSCFCCGWNHICCLFSFLLNDTKLMSTTKILPASMWGIFLCQNSSHCFSNFSQMQKNTLFSFFSLILLVLSHFQFCFVGRKAFLEQKAFLTNDKTKAKKNWMNEQSSNECVIFFLSQFVQFWDPIWACKPTWTWGHQLRLAFQLQTKSSKGRRSVHLDFHSTIPPNALARDRVIFHSHLHTNSWQQTGTKLLPNIFLLNKFCAFCVCLFVFGWQMIQQNCNQNQTFLGSQNSSFHPQETAGDQGSNNQTQKSKQQIVTAELAGSV